MLLGDLEEIIGGEVWPAAHLLLHWFAGAPALGAPVIRGKALLELGAGTGFLALGLTGSDSKVGVCKVFATEGNEQAFQDMLSNEDVRSRRDSVKPIHWDWEQSSVPPPDVRLEDVDLVIATDVVYSGADQSKLVDALVGLFSSKRARAGICAFFLLCDRPSIQGHVGVKRLRSSGMTAVELFLHDCAKQDLKVSEYPLPRSFLQSALGTLDKDGGDGSGGVLRLFEISAVSTLAESQSPQKP